MRQAAQRNEPVEHSESCENAEALKELRAWSLEGPRTGIEFEGGTDFTMRLGARQQGDHWQEAEGSGSLGTVVHDKSKTHGAMIS